MRLVKSKFKANSLQERAWQEFSAKEAPADNDVDGFLKTKSAVLVYANDMWEPLQRQPSYARLFLFPLMRRSSQSTTDLKDRKSLLDTAENLLRIESTASVESLNNKRY